MSGIGSALLGSKGGQVKAQDLTPQAYKNLRNPLADMLRQFMSGTGGSPLGGVPGYAGPYAAPMTGQESALVGQIGQQAQAPVTNPLLAGSANYLTQTMSGQGLDPASNPFLAGSLEATLAPIRRAYMEDVVPNVRAQFTQAGQMIQPEGSSPFDETMRRSGRDYMEQIANTSSNVLNANFERERNLQASAAGQAGQQGLGINQAEMQNLVTGLQSSALPRLVEQLGIEGGTQAFNQRIQTLLEAMRLAGGLSTPNTVASSSPATGSAVPGMLSGAGNAAMGLAALQSAGFLSDARAKDDMEIVGKTPGGLPVYSFHYKGEDKNNPLRLGVMAQDAEKLQPSAVFPLKAVDYAKVR